MKRPLPRSYFWIDQTLIRQGVWLKLSAPTRLTYIALAASVDRQGLSIWSRSKLMPLAACGDADQFEKSLSELEGQGLIQRHPSQNPPAIFLCSFETEQSGGEIEKNKTQAVQSVGVSPVSIHTHIHWGGGPHVEPGHSD